MLVQGVGGGGGLKLNPLISTGCLVRLGGVDKGTNVRIPPLSFSAEM